MTTPREPPTITATDPMPVVDAPPIHPGPLAPVRILRIEGAALALVAVMLYARTDAGWWMFAAVLMLPDLGMVGFVRGPSVGTLTYNLTHTLAVPLTLAAGGLILGHESLLHVSLVWIAHIGADRAMGYGLKYPGHFRDTHLQRLGGPRARPPGQPGG